jgi:hypothetical protein
MAGNLVPRNDGVSDLGASDRRWKVGHFSDGVSSSNLSVGTDVDSPAIRYANGAWESSNDGVTWLPLGSGSAVIQATVNAAAWATGSVLVGTVPAGKTVSRVAVAVSIVFGAGRQITVGDVGGQGRLVVAVDSNLQMLSTYMIDVNWTYVNTTEVRVYTIGAAPITGSASVVVYLS